MTFVDIDPICEDRAIIAAHKAREVYKHDIILKFANQTLKGVIEPEARKWFDIGSDMVDMIGGLPYRDELDYGRGLKQWIFCLMRLSLAALCVMCMWTNLTPRKKKKPNKLCDKTIEHGMEVESWRSMVFPLVRIAENTAISFMKKCVRQK